ncbi:MAG: transcription elongation factor subunit Spt4 [Candidatus Micrarchaeota archaeon]
MTKACKNCHLIVEEAAECPLCKGTDFSEKFNSIALIFDATKSEIAAKLGVKAPGRYAIKVR